MKHAVLFAIFLAVNLSHSEDKVPPLTEGDRAAISNLCSGVVDYYNGKREKPPALTDFKDILEITKRNGIQLDEDKAKGLASEFKERFEANKKTLSEKLDGFDGALKSMKYLDWSLRNQTINNKELRVDVLIMTKVTINEGEQFLAIYRHQVCKTGNDWVMDESPIESQLIPGGKQATARTPVSIDSKVIKLIASIAMGNGNNISVKKESRLKEDVKFDELDMAELVMGIEDSFKIKMDDEIDVLKSFITVNDVVGFVKTEVGKIKASE